MHLFWQVHWSYCRDAVHVTVLHLFSRVVFLVLRREITVVVLRWCFACFVFIVRFWSVWCYVSPMLRHLYFGVSQGCLLFRRLEVDCVVRIGTRYVCTLCLFVCLSLCINDCDYLARRSYVMISGVCISKFFSVKCQAIIVNNSCR